MSSIQFLKWLPTLLEGIKITMITAVVGIFLSILVGAVVAMLMAYDNAVISAILRVYISIFRNAPLLVIIFFFYYGLPLINVTLSGMICGIISIALNEGAFVAEILRGSIKSIPVGEVEAACSLGLKKGTVVRKVIFPLAFKNSVPMLTGQASVVVKDSSLFSIIMVTDLMRAGNMFYEKYLNSASIWLVGAIYIIIFFVITFIGRMIEKRVMVRR